MQKVILLKPYGPCFGVNNAIQVALNARNEYPNEKITILGMIVHNQYFVNFLASKGIDTLVSDVLPLEELILSIDEGIVIFTAHGHSEYLEKLALHKGLIIKDATCPIVKKIIDEIKAHNDEDIIYIGKENHPEVNAALSYSSHIYRVDSLKEINALPPLKHPLVLNQSTYSFLDIKHLHEAIKKKYNDANIIDELCHATSIRQHNILSLPEETDLLYVVGDVHSSNVQRLVEVGEHTLKKGKVKKIATYHDIIISDVKNASLIAITSGTSTPHHLVEEVYDYCLKLTNED